MNKPLHSTLTERLRQMIFSDDGYDEGDRLPTEPVLARNLGVSRATLRETLKQLESEGIVYRRHGLGTFVKSRTPSIALTLSIPRSVTTMIESLNFIPGTASMNIVTESVFPDDVERLNISPGSEVVRIERLRTANSQPVAYTIDVVPYWIMTHYPQWEGSNNFSLIEHLTYKCGVRFKETKSTLIPLHNVQSIAEKLEIDPSSHIFFLEGVDNDVEGRPVMLTREYFSPWIFKFSVIRTPPEI